MTVQLATTVRNTTNGYFRNYVYGLNNLNAGLLRTLVVAPQRYIRGVVFNDDQLKQAGAFAAKEGVADLKMHLVLRI